MFSYGQYCPVAKAAELLAERWTPLILRELLSGAHHFNELERGLPGIPRSLLASRLRRLEKAGVITRHTASHGHATEYRLTPAGQQLRGVVEALGNWGAEWAFGDPIPEELDPSLLLWKMKQGVNLHLLPPQRIVVQFDVRGQHTGSYWLVMEPTEVSICLQHPGFEIDVLVTADIAALYRVWLGRMTLAEALYEDLIELDGTTPLVRAFPGWFALSPFASVVHAAVVAKRKGSDPAALPGTQT